MTLIITASPLLSQPSNSDSLPYQVESIEAAYPFFEGATGERRVFELIERSLDEFGVEHSRLRFEELPGVHSFSSVVHAHIAGRSDDRLAIAVPVSAPERAPLSRSGAISLSAALIAASRIAQTTPPVSIDFYFLGAERGIGPEFPLGSRLVLDRVDADPPQALVYVDVAGATGWAEGASELVVFSGSRGMVAPDWLARAARNLTESAGIPAVIDDRATQLFRINAAPPGRSFLLEPWLAADVPAVLLVDADSRYMERRDALDERFESPVSGTAAERRHAAELLAEALSELPQHFSEGIPQRWDRHTIALTVGDRRFAVGERNYLIALLAVAGLAMLYGSVYRKPLARYIRTIRRNFWTLPVLFGTVFAYLGVAGAIAEWLLSLRPIPELWRFAPLVTVLFKLTLASALFQATYLLVGRLPLSRNGSFYTASALVIVFVSILVFAALNIALSAYFLIAFIFVFLFSISRRRLMKLLWLAGSLVPLAVLATVAFTRHAEEVVEVFITGWFGDLLLSAALLPALLLFIRLGFLFSHPRKGRSAFAVKLVTTVLVTATTALAVYLLVFPPFDDETPQIVRVTDSRNFEENSRAIELASTAALPEIEYGRTRFVPDGSRTTYRRNEMDLPDRMVTMAVLDSESFLGRTQFRIEINAPQRIRSLDIELHSDAPLLVYNSNFPFTPVEEGRRTLIHIGRNPPRPIEVEIVIPVELEVELKYTAELPAVPPRTEAQYVLPFARTIERGSFPITSGLTEEEEDAEGEP